MDTTLRGQPAGQLLDGRYRVTSSIAHGGMATVYMGVDTRLDRPVAIKIMHAELAADQDFVARFIREARSIAQLSHPNVVAVYDQGADGHHLYLAMEYVAGSTLRQLLSERGRLSPGDALDIIENVLAAPDGRIKVADFGLARSMGVTSHTKTGVLMGTVAYLAPEQVTESTSDARCDVYAAGVVLYELLTGHQPHTGESALAVAYKHVNQPVPPPSAAVAGLPPVLDALVALATHRDPRLRPADAEQFLYAVSQVRKGNPIPWQPQLEAPLDGPGPQPPYLAAEPQPGYPPAQHGQFGPTPEGPVLPSGGGGAPFERQQFRPGPPVPQPTRGTAGIPGFPPRDSAPPTGPAYPTGNQTLIVQSGGPPEPGEREPRLQRWLFSRRLACALAVIVVAALAAGLVWWQTEGRYTRVPGVGGLSVAAAGSELRGMGFTVRTGTAQLDNKVAKGEVMATVPATSSRVRKGATIELIPSAGPKLIGVPQVSGLTLAQAQAALRKAGLTPGAVTNQVSATIAVGIVISTTPGTGASQPQPDPVRIVVSAGPPLPNFVGQQQAAAQSWASASGVSLNEQPAASSTQPQGTITRQSPAPNTPVTKGEVVTIYISPGPPQVAVPNVDGMSLVKAYQALRAAGFQVTATAAGPFGHTVFNYSPSGQAPKGSTITVYYGLPNL